MKAINFKKITLRLQASNRGGGIEISLDTLGYPGVKMTAYQNYLGGGMLGSIQNDCNMPTNEWQADPKLVEISEQLKRYFHSLTNPDTEWEGQSYEQRQNMPVSAY